MIQNTIPIQIETREETTKTETVITGLKSGKNFVTQYAIQ
jgi:hypothetical protein